MRLDEFTEGPKILSKYFVDLGYHIASDHDQFYVYATDHPVSELDVERLIELGWHQPAGAGRCSSGYDPSESWSCWV